MSRKSLIKSSFARSISTYDANADIQAHVGARLREFLPSLVAPKVLELGCGTGVFTAELLSRYRDGQFMISDFLPDAVATCSARFGTHASRSYQLIDGDNVSDLGEFDVIASSMALHWFADPISSLQSQRAALSAGGCIVYATIGSENFPEWIESVTELGLESGVATLDALPGIVAHERKTIEYGSARGFLDALKKTGAAIAKPGHRPLSPNDLAKACANFDKKFAGSVTWHIVYGVIPAQPSGRETQYSMSECLEG